MIAPPLSIGSEDLDTIVNALGEAIRAEVKLG